MTLTEEVTTWVEEQESEGYSSALGDLLEYGCISGMVSDLIYYSDTTAFYARHREEINGLLSEALSNLGFADPGELFGDKWDPSDPLALDTQNQNLLAWFGFEETAYLIAGRRQNA